ncbi:PHP domain-containing protein [Spirochaetota bacterium]
MSSIVKRHNLHTHSTFSDGVVSPFQLVKEAVIQGLDIIGISDHAFSLKMNNHSQVSQNISEYYDELSKIKKSMNDVEVLIGIEIDASLNTGHDPKDLPFDVINLCDYVLFESVHTDYESWGIVGKRDIREILNIRNMIKIPVGLAHNDLQRNFNGREEYITKLLSENDIFIELNDSNSSRNIREGKDYFLHFSNKLISCMKEMDVKIVIGSDSHTGADLNTLDSAYDFANINTLSFHPMVL